MFVFEGKVNGLLKDGTMIAKPFLLPFEWPSEPVVLRDAEFSAFVAGVVLHAA